MKYEGLIFTLDDGKDYMVIETVEVEGVIYAYLTNEKNEVDSFFGKITNKDYDLHIENVSSEEFSEKVLPGFIAKNYGNE